MSRHLREALRESSAPFHTLKWTLKDYQGSLNDIIEDVYRNRSSDFLSNASVMPSINR
ncbi:10063_t:CDS:2 [Funneliformis mosseae]|uniref:10063_t:CDS:1 n=1 Tax=Funneliformis mosseae TaxID=27381 RepID=A0A9N9DFU0_FUNMO|nr:10063_t:CDS:2 [Funneliformis mosseae]